MLCKWECVLLVRENIIFGAMMPNCDNIWNTDFVTFVYRHYCIELRAWTPCKKGLRWIIVDSMLCRNFCNTFKQAMLDWVKCFFPRSVCYLATALFCTSWHITQTCSTTYIRRSDCKVLRMSLWTARDTTRRRTGLTMIKCVALDHRIGQPSTPLTFRGKICFC